MKNLTKTELKIVELLAKGLTNKAIGEEMYISPHTVKAHIEHIYNKLDVHNRIQLVVKYLNNV